MRTRRGHEGRWRGGAVKRRTLGQAVRGVRGCKCCDTDRCLRVSGDRATGTGRCGVGVEAVMVKSGQNGQSSGRPCAHSTQCARRSFLHLPRPSQLGGTRAHCQLLIQQLTSPAALSFPTRLILHYSLASLDPPHPTSLFRITSRSLPSCQEAKTSSSGLGEETTAYDRVPSTALAHSSNLPRFLSSQEAVEEKLTYQPGLPFNPSLSLPSLPPPSSSTTRAGDAQLGCLLSNILGVNIGHPTLIPR
jgi:hypothetical protein